MNTLLRTACRRTLPALAAALLLAACAGDSADTAGIVPVEITRSTASTIDGMLLADHPGPKAQIHYAGQTEPDFFCNTRDMMFVYLAPEALRKVNAIFVQDMGRADWDEPLGHWINAREAWFVAGSNRRGSMGPTLASFADKADAENFTLHYGGEVLHFDQVDLNTVEPPAHGL